MGTVEGVSYRPKDRERRTGSVLSSRRVVTGQVRTCVPALPRRGEAAPPNEPDPDSNVVRGVD